MQVVMRFSFTYSALNFLVVILSSTCNGSIIPVPVIQSLDPIELSALHNLYLSTFGDGWNWQSEMPQSTHWNFSGSPNPCLEQWQYLTCVMPSGSIYEHIQSMNFQLNRMAGTLPTSIGNFTFLTSFSVKENPKLIGSIPSTVGKLSNLQTLSMQQISLTGGFPTEIYDLIHLSELILEEIPTLNIGNFPNQLNRLVNLSDIAILNCSVTGTLPENICDLDNIKHLSVGYNQLTGTIPPCYFAFPFLKNIYVNSNFLTGSLSNTFSNLTQVISIFLYNNYLTGTIPDMSKLEYLRFIVSNNNQLSGTIPYSIASSEKIGLIEISFNQLTGELPSKVVNPNKTYNSSIGYGTSNNLLTGSIPLIMTETLTISYYSMGYNYFTGKLPLLDEIHTVGVVFNNNFFSGPINRFSVSNSNLGILSINDNFLTGTISSFNNKLKTAYLQNNAFTGHFFSSLPKDRLRNQTDLIFVDVSNNRLTGTLPSEAFGSGFLSHIVSFAATGNCFSGSVPDSICQLHEMLFLDLDGLSTAPACRTKLFRHLPSLKSFLLQNTITGSIPLCLFNMPKLQTLHISGNDIAWSFPSDGYFINNISESLSKLSLAHNQLTGTVPTEIWSKQWQTLDLSFNKLSGIIPANTTLINDNASLVLQVNRFSGMIPHSLVQQQNINILTGNMFTCSVSRDQLPLYDTAYLIYQCGSNSFNQSAIIWCSFLLAVLFLSVCCLVYSNYFQYCEIPLFNWWSTTAHKFSVYSKIVENSTGNLREFYEYLHFTRQTFIALTIILIVVGLPLYIILSASFATQSVEYAWLASAAYLSGTQPAVILFVVYICWLVTLFVVWWHINHRMRSSTITSLSTRTRSTAVDFKINWIRPVLHCAVILLNCLIMLAVNGGYVYVILNYNTQVIFSMQLCMALFKLFWNDFALRGIMYHIRNTTSLLSSSHEYNIAIEMPTMTFMVLFNTIIAPCLATASVDPSCFVNAFVQPPEVSTAFPSFSCENSDFKFGECALITPTESLVHINYDAPFTYRYQCSSALLTSYASVYVYMFLFVALIKPFVLIQMSKWYEELQSTTILHIIVNNTMFNMLKSASKVVEKNDEIVFHVDRYTLRMLSKIAVFFTFGVVFPPLAVVICVAIVSETYLNQVILGRFLHLIPIDVVREQFTLQIAKDCEGALELLLMPLITLVVPFAALFYAFFLFDIYGDQVGAKNAMWLSVLMAATPALIYVCFNLYLVCIRIRGSVSGKNVTDISPPVETVIEMTQNKLFMMKVNDE